MPIQLEVYTPEGLALEAETPEVVATGGMGQFGVLPGHTYLISTIEPGPLTWQADGGRQSVEIGAGFCEVGDDKMVLLVERYGAEEAGE